MDLEPHVSIAVWQPVWVLTVRDTQADSADDRAAINHWWFPSDHKVAVRVM